MHRLRIKKSTLNVILLDLQVKVLLLALKKRNLILYRGLRGAHWRLGQLKSFQSQKMISFLVNGEILNEKNSTRIPIQARCRKHC